MTRHYKGRHRAPSTGAGTAARVAVVAAAAVGTPLATAGAAQAAEIPWDNIVACESGGKNVPNASGSSASGYFQITNGTWKANGGGEFASRAIGASFEEQFTVAKRIAERRGSAADWAASRDCWKSGRKSVNLSKLGGGSEEPKAKAKPKAKSEPKREAPAPAAAGGGELPGGYTVQAGDTLSKLAQRYGVPGGYEALAQRNGIANPDLIFVGQALR